MSDEENKFHIGEITASFGVNIAGIDVWHNQGSLVYVLAEVFDEEDANLVLWYVIMKPDSKVVQRVNSDYLNIKSRGIIPRFPHFIED
ncbi:hypothetical protein [Bacillus sp. B1-b2]|uniref:hypothetical protein n=1 Tax=Bacillus sp. B1-b2 TaxID=2653201 RepID=UPI00126226C6|nr:hypothetical protein [Bacillus sp. B1-b2]KAB7668924.1 hypothetical protein F9279_12020 [Bacillus sp. B1-b2]